MTALSYFHSSLPPIYTSVSSLIPFPAYLSVGPIACISVCLYLCPFLFLSLLIYSVALVRKRTTYLKRIEGLGDHHAVCATVHPH
jgi:hypothetical protein